MNTSSIRSSRLDAALRTARDTKALDLGRGAVARTAELFRAEFGPSRGAVVVADAVTMPLAGKTIAAQLACEAFVFEDPHLHAEHSFVERLEASLRSHDRVPIAVGAGTINDIVKLSAHRTGRQYLCVATAASMDGYTAYGASITHRGSKQTFDCPAPRAVVADIDIIRAAPAEMTASGYADLLAKVPAGADWIVADALGVEPIHREAWEMVQGTLRGAVSDPRGVRAGEPPAIENLVEGLLMSGFAMQTSKSSRPASGAEHQFSHLWDMQHHVYPATGVAPSHGFKVGIGTLASTRLYEALFEMPIDRLDVEAAVARWPAWEGVERDIRARFDVPELRDKAVEETRAKWIEPDALREQLIHLRSTWPTLKETLHAQFVLDHEHMMHALREVGAAHRSPQIGIDVPRLRASYRLAYHIRRRFTVLDLAERAGVLEEAIASIFGPGR